MTQPTPTPYERRAVSVYSTNGHPISHCGVYTYGPKLSVANAEFIVRACNAYGPLVDTVRHVEWLLKPYSCVRPEIGAALNHLRQALKDIGEDTP